MRFDRVAPAFKLREIHERIRERFAVRIPFAPPGSRLKRFFEATGGAPSSRARRTRPMRQNLVEGDRFGAR